MHCEDIIIPPRELVLTNARDNKETNRLLDIHTFTKFFTYQLPVPGSSDTNMVQTRFDPRVNHYKENGGNNDLILRLRASLKSAHMDNSQQGMRVSIAEEQSNQVIVDASSEDNDEKHVHLDSISISSSHSYVIKYEFFQKEVGLRSFDNKLQQVSAGHMGSSSCTKPFVVQELVIASKELISNRVQGYKDSQKYQNQQSVKSSLEEFELSKIDQRCSFSTLENAKNDLKHGEAGLYCPRSAFQYSLEGEAPQELNIIFEKSFTIGGAEHEAVTYLFDLTLGFDFATSAQLKAVLQRQKAGSNEFVYDPLSCLLDHSCIESEQVGKNEIGIDVIITNGNYKLMILDQQENSVRRWLTQDEGLSHVPFTFELQATPVVQNEERVMCGDKLYLGEQFIQNRFIDHKNGQRFTFDDDVILSFVNTTQKVTIAPEADMVLKMSAKEAYGVNMIMQLCTNKGCTKSSTRAGNTNVLYATVKKGTSYYIELNYSGSIIVLSSFYDCPHARVKISMMKIDEAKERIKEQQNKPSDWLKQKIQASDEQLTGIFSTLSRSATIKDAGYMLNDADDIFYYEARNDQDSSKVESKVIVSKDFVVPQGTERQILIEIYFDPQFYDLELLVESREAGEVRSHMYSGRQNKDISMYKGDSRVFVEAEPGDYTLKIIAKLPGRGKDTIDLMPKYYEFQFHAVAAETLPSRVLRPTSLNYFGLLGPTGVGFGQLVYLAPEILLEPRDYIELELTIQGPSQNQNGHGPTIDVQAIEMDGEGQQLDIHLTEVSKEEAQGGPPPKEKHPKSSRYLDDWEDGVSYESLVSTDIKNNVKYVMKLANRDPAKSARASLKLVVTEHQETKSSSESQIVPQSFEEVMRIKPKVAGLKESSFIQGSNAVMQTFKVAALQPFVPKTQKVYQAVFRTGEGTDDSFMPSLPFTVTDASAQLYVQVIEFSGREDLFVSVYSDSSDEGSGQRQVARSSLGKYANSLGPVTLTKGKYRLLVHPDQDSQALAANSEVIRFGLDVLLEQSDIGGDTNFDVVIEEVELCSLPALPDSFNGPGFLHPLSGYTLQMEQKFRLAELLESTAVNFELNQPSLVMFYLELPEGIQAKASLNRIKGTYKTLANTEDLNKDEETFLRQGGGFEHRKVIQIREFLDAGAYKINIIGNEATGSGARLMPRCEAYLMSLTVTPHTKGVAQFRDDQSCENSQFMPEHLTFDEVKNGTLNYPVSETTTDVAYINLDSSGEGPFFFFFQVQYDPRIEGVIGLSLSKYNSETTKFTQSALWRSPQAGITQVLSVVESGTYAIGIQTLSSTKTMFLSGGLGSKGNKGAHGKLLHDDCIGISYTYLVISSLRHDSRVMDGATNMLSLILGGGMEKLVQQHDRNIKLQDELGDPTLLESCPHEDLPESLPRSETGFDRSFTLMIQEKPADVLDVIIDQESIIRVAIHTKNSKNQVKAYIYENSKTQAKGHNALAWSTGSRLTSSLLYTLKPQRKAYRLKLEYDGLDMDDPCPTYDLRIIVKPLSEVVWEHLQCTGKKSPPASIDVLPTLQQGQPISDEFRAGGDFAFSYDFLKSQDVDTNGGLEYDIALEFPGADPNADYYLDLESQSDVMTGQITFSLLYEDKNKLLKPLGKSKPVGSSAHSSRFIQRLKLLDTEGDLADDVVLSGTIMRLRLPPSSIKLLDFLQKGGHAENELCHNFQLSLRAELRSGINEDGSQIVGPNRLIRVRFEGEEVEEGQYNPASRFYATLEFDRSMKAAFQLLKANQFVRLVPEKPLEGQNHDNRDEPDAVLPGVKKLSTTDPSNIILQFPAGSLKAGWCHRLELSSVGGGTDFDTDLLEDDLKICATPTGCHCNWAGTKHCAEDTGICECKWPHIGKDCSLCDKGHVKDPGTGRCVPANKCKDNGGTEDCQGHGICVQKGNIAQCNCNPGFANDGLEQCARCTDALFEYPDCHVRQWSLSESDISRKDLDYKMPKTLWKDSSAGATGKDIQGTPLQGEDGVLDWAHRYSLIDGKNQMRKESIHSFKVQSGSVFRLLVDTGISGALVRYRLLDSQSAEILTSDDVEGTDSDGFIRSASEVTVLHAPKHKKPEDAPFVIHFEYKHEGGPTSQSLSENFNPWVDLHLILEPLITAREAIQCTDQELQKTQEQKPKLFEFGSSSKFINQNVILRSDDKTLYTHDGKESTAFATQRFNIDVRNSGNALSIITTYAFSNMALSLALIEQSTGNVIKLERLSSLEADGEDTNSPLSELHDTSSYIEVPSLAAGQYRLEVALRRSLFLPTKKYPTCLDFDLVLEYVARTHQAAIADGQYEVLSVRPLTMSKLEVTSARVIEVDFDRDIVLDDLVSSQSDRLNICTLINTNGDSKDVIRPKNFQNAQSTLRLSFDFARASPSLAGKCYRLQCSTKATKGEENIIPLEEETSYCFESSQEHDHNGLSHCNPLAMPKLDRNGNCKCSAPYTGQYCMQCESGYKAVKEKQTGVKHGEPHTRCILDYEHLSKEVCSSHGRPKANSVSNLADVECTCDQGYGGAFCDYCLDAALAYPDCGPELSSAIYNDQAAHAFLSRRKYNEHGYSTSAAQYFSEDALEPTVFNEQCGWVDFPDDLNRIEFAKEFSNDEFHFADLYVVNHKQDNIMKFQSHSTGVLKILLQQPESEELLAGNAESAFDIEIGVYDPEAKKFLASAMNRHLTLPNGRTGKLEYASLTFETREEHLSRPLYIFFRALNFTDDDGEGHKAMDGCLALFLEAEFRQMQPTCKRNPSLEPSSEIKQLQDQSQATVLAEAAVQVGRGKSGSEHSVTDPSNTFFAYQDFYLPPGRGSASQSESDSIVTVSLQQKFIESNTLDILIEVLESDVDFESINRDQYSPRMSQARQIGDHDRVGHGTLVEEKDGRAQQSLGSFGPTCHGVCLVGGEKSYNEMQRVVELGVRTYFRVWVFQQAPTSREVEQNWCANFEFLVSARDAISADNERLSKELRCKAEPLPHCLDNHRYLKGLDGKQKDFHYRESFRVDHLWHNSAHKVSFTLYEPSVIRVVAPIHRHLDFELVLNQDQGPYSHKTVIRAKKEDYHSTIFAQLAPGEYHIKLAFVSDASLLQLPCQTVQLEMSIMTLERAKAKAQIIQESKGPMAVEKLDLTSLLVHSSTHPLELFKHAVVGWRHVEPGLPPYIDQTELYHEIMREKFEISEDDEAGLVVELQSDFLLSGVNMAISNQETGTIVEDERRDSSGKLIIGRLQPGTYELVLYTHECITNMDPAAGKIISSFDLALKLSVRLLRLYSHGDGVTRASLAASVPVEVLEHSNNNNDNSPKMKESDPALPLVVTPEELACLKEYLPLPETLDGYAAMGAVDVTEAFFINTQSFYTHDITFTPKKGQTALRIILTKSNSKLALIEGSSQRTMVQSRPIEYGKAQLLIATKLQVGTQYKLVLEFSEQAGVLAAEGSEACSHFMMSFRTYDSGNICNFVGVQQVQDTIVTSIDDEPQTTTFWMQKKSDKKGLKINVPHGTDHIDLEVVLDHSDTFYSAGLTLRTASSSSEGDSSHHKSNSQEATEEKDQRRNVSPSSLDFSRKHAVVYLFTDIQGGTYELKLRQRFKESGCVSPITVTVKAQKALSSGVEVDTGFLGHKTLYQSQAEEQERPRAASKLPLNLGTYKFMGGEQEAGSSTGVNGGHLLWSGPVQLDQLESQNRIAFNVMNNNTLLRVYIETAGLLITLSETGSDHAREIKQGISLYESLAAGSYSIQLGHGTHHARKTAELLPPRTQLTIMLVDPQAHDLYNKTWENAIGKCDAGSSFPLALKQQKQSDSHQLYYNYPLIKVSPSVLHSSTVLQTYNFRLNVTSRMYFEVGMHMLNSHVTLQLSVLGQQGYTIQGKQRGNLNVLDTQLGPGDYSVALRQSNMPDGSWSHPTCGIFSLQGLLEPINLMSASANSGEILQRGIASCPEAADGDILPPQIFASKSATKGGGELHIDAIGHFMKKFRNVLFKMSREYSELVPESDRIELAVDQDSLLHLTFLYKAYESNEIRVLLTDTNMMGQPVAPQASFKVQDIEDEHVELVVEYKLGKGRHYALTVTYVGSPQQSEEGHTMCSVYDLTMSIAHQTQIIEEAKCEEAGGDIPSMLNKLPKKITDRDLDNNGEYKYKELVKLAYPHDFQDIEKIAPSGRGAGRDILSQRIDLQLNSNFDIKVSVESEYDQALYTLALTEQVRGGSGELRMEQSHLQSPLVFKQNNDRYKSIRRELVADDVESSGQSRGHILTITNQQADIFHLAHKEPNQQSCLYVKVKIYIKATKKSAQNLYSTQTRHSGSAPTILGIRPSESPAFVHGRTTEAHFDIRFSTKPYSTGPIRHEEQVDAHLGAHIKLKAALLSLADGSTTEVLLEPMSVRHSNKAYQEDEYHVAVVFDLMEYQTSATEKLTHAQLVIEEHELVDGDNHKFTIVRKLADAGLPIYVFEQNDMEQLLSEENDDVKASIENTALGHEAEHDDQAGSDVSSDLSSFEKKVEAEKRKKAAKNAKVKCRCANGTCRPGQATCSQCNSGWRGNNCDVPSSSSQTHVNKNKSKDYTKDGLYRPKQIGDQRLTGSAGKKWQPKDTQKQERQPQIQQQQQQIQQQTQPSQSQGGSGSDSSSLAPKKIEGEVSSQTSVVAPEQDQGLQGIQEGAEAQTIQSSSDDSGSSKASNLLFVALILFVLYALSGGVDLCPKRASQEARSYRPLGEQADGVDSDGDEEAADPTVRRRMMELSSFGSKSKSEESKGESSEAKDSQSKRTTSFPMTSFSRAADQTQPAATGQNQQNTQEDDAAEQLQRELELFAQDDDEEEGSLMPSGHSRDAGTIDQAQPQNFYQATDPNRGPAHPRDDDDDNEMQEFENYFDQR